MKDSGFISQGETPSAEDVNDAFQKLNWMLAEWQQQRTLVYHLVQHTLDMTGVQEYTVGPGGDVDVTQRPNEIDSAVYRQTPVGSFPIEISVDVIKAYEDWQLIRAKSISGPPRAVFLDTNWPTATLHVWPIPQAGLYQLRLIFKMVLSEFTSLTQELSLPPIYYSALNWNLALRLSAMTGDSAPNPLTIKEAGNSLRLLRAANSQIRRLRMPDGIPQRNRDGNTWGYWY